MSRLRFRPLPLNLAVLLPMLAVVLVSVGGTFALSGLVLQREFRKLPAEVQTYLRVRDEALRKGETPPQPPRPQLGQRTGGPATPPASTASPSAPQTPTLPNAAQGTASTSTNRTDRQPWPVRQVDWLRSLQRQLMQIGLVAVAVSALLAMWLARRISAPVTVVSQAAERLAAGESGVRVPVFGGERELAGLAHSFNRMAQTLEQVETERRQAVSDIAHELRTPLAVMQARLDALEDGIYPMQTDQVKLLSAQTQHLTRLVGDLRTLTLLDAGQLALHCGPTNLARLAGEVVDGLQVQALGRSLTLSLQEVEGAEIHADAGRMRQVMTNLIENALRHARAQVEVRVVVDGPFVRLTVDDDGSGIPDDKREQIFTRFTRLDESRTRDVGGSGLGLTIVRALVTAHKGVAEVQTSPLGGARLSVRLPLLRSDAPERRGEVSPA